MARLRAVVWIAVLGGAAAALAGHATAQGEALHALHRGDIGVLRAPGAAVGMVLSPLPAGGELVAIVVVAFAAFGAIAWLAGRAFGWPVGLLVLALPSLVEQAAHGNPNLVWVAVALAFVRPRPPRRIAPLVVLLVALAPFEASWLFAEVRPNLRDDARARHDLRAALDDTPVCKPVGGDPDVVRLLAVLYGDAVAQPPRLGTFVTETRPQRPPTGYGLAAQRGDWSVYKRCAPAVVQHGGE
jgi:hypothetical protein